MTATIDAYHTWLGISPAEQPPHHYRLLGVPIFETDLSVIGNAADRQSVYVKTFLSGKHAQVAERIWAEIGTARMCLFDAQRRADYDSKLRTRLSAATTSAPRLAGDTTASQSYARPAPRAFAESSAVALQEPEPVAPPPRQKKRTSTASAPASVAPARKAKSAVPLLAVGGIGLLVLVVGVVFALQSAFPKKKKPVEVTKVTKKDEPPIDLKQPDRGSAKKERPSQPLESLSTGAPEPEAMEFEQPEPETNSKTGSDEVPDPRQAPIDFGNSLPGLGDGLNSIPTPASLADSFGSSGASEGVPKILAEVHMALETRDYEAARALLAKANDSKPSLAETAEIVHLQMLEKYLASFWQAVQQGISQSALGDKVSLEGEEFELVDRKLEVISYKAGDETKETSVLQLDPKVAAAFASRAGKPDDPLALIHIGTFLAVDLKGGLSLRPWQVSHAKKLWNDAVALELKDQYLAKELGLDLSGRPKKAKREKRAN